MIVLDTHALLWWALDPDKLSEKARHTVDGMERQGGFVSSSSIWELGIRAKRGKLVLPIPIEELVRRLEQGASSSWCLWTPRASEKAGLVLAPYPSSNGPALSLG